MSTRSGNQPVLDVKNLETAFKLRNGAVHAVNSVSFYVRPGELLGVVGESGSGKSVTMMSLIGLLPSPPAQIRNGEVLFDGLNLLSTDASSLRAIRGGKIGYVFQDPMTSLNPVFDIGFQICEPLRKHLNLSKAAAKNRAVELLELVGIPDARSRLGDYPHQFSGGMRQRVMIAIALACDPQVLIADEPTTALDVTIQAQILELIKQLREKLGMAIIWITHDLGVVASIADRVMVMYGGQIVEQAPVRELFANPQHPYTRALLAAMPSVRRERTEKLKVIGGHPPIMTSKPVACTFRDRCSNRVESCSRENPLLRPVNKAHEVACFHHSARELRTLPADISPSSQRQSSPHPDASSAQQPMVRIRNLKMCFPLYGGLLKRQVGAVKAVNGVSFDIREGETLALVGESGCGKSTIGRSILRLYDVTAGSIRIDGVEIAKASPRSLRDVRPLMQMIFQDPQASLNPRMTIGNIIGEPLREHSVLSKKNRLARVHELMDQVGLSSSFIDRYSHEFSGGQRQRIGIARALALNPRFIVCDEPIAALDVSIQAQVVNLLEELQDRLGLTYLFISHDLSMVRHIADRVAVMYLGQIVELSSCDTLYRNPLHPYTQALLSAVPEPDPEVEKRVQRIILQGDVPSPVNPPTGCNFCTRCPQVMDVCKQIEPELTESHPGRFVACHLIDSNTHQGEMP